MDNPTFSPWWLSAAPNNRHKARRPSLDIYPCYLTWLLFPFPLLIHSRMTKRFAQPDADTRRSRLTEKIGGHLQLHDGRIRRIHRLAPRSIGALLGTLDLLRFKPAPFFPFLSLSLLSNSPLVLVVALSIIRTRDYLYTYKLLPLPGLCCFAPVSTDISRQSHPSFCLCVSQVFELNGSSLPLMVAPERHHAFH
jgi:hypothetical protein